MRVVRDKTDTVVYIIKYSETIAAFRKKPQNIYYCSPNASLDMSVYAHSEVYLLHV